MSEKSHSSKGEFGTLAVAKKTFRWVIDDLVVNFTKSKLVSPKFSHKSVDSTAVKWYIELGCATLADNKQRMAISICCSHKVKVDLVIDITILDNSNDEVFRYSKSDMDLSVFSRLFFCFVPMETLVNKKVSSNGSNKFTLVVAFVSNQYYEMRKKRAWEERSQLDCLNSFAKLANNKQFSDVTFDVEGEELYAYKGILASRSPVFMAMFSHNTTEVSCNRVTIDDISYNTMHDLIEYIYTAVVPQFVCDEAQEKCKNLLIAADKYGLEKLKLKMEEKLALDFQVRTVFEYLNFADAYNAECLKEKAIEFIISHSNEIAGSEVYKKFSDLHPNVSCEVFHSLLVKRRKLN